MAAAVLPLPGAPLLALSADDALLGASSGATLHAFSTQRLLSGDAAPLATVQLPATVTKLAWRPGAAAEYAALLDDGSVHLGSLGSGAPPAQLALPGDAAASGVAWSPDGGRLVVGAGEHVLVLAPSGGGAWQASAAVQVLSSEVQGDDMQLAVDSLAWVAPTSILVSCQLSAGGAEQPYAPLAMLTWRYGADPAADGLELAGVLLLLLLLLLPGGVSRHIQLPFAALLCTMHSLSSRFK